MAPTHFDVNAVREQVPALNQRINGSQPVYFDNPGGTQVPQRVIDAISRYLIEANSNSHGAFLTSRRTDETIQSAREAVADLLNAPSAQQIVFGPNMTTLTFGLSRAIGQTLNPGDEIILTRMDHDANVSPWLLVARDRGLTVHWVDFDVETGLLDVAQMAELAGERTKLIACVYASNALGTVNDIPRVVEIAHSVGALAAIDAVQYAPHGPIDVQALGCDFLTCSAYKFFGPRVGALYGRAELLESLPAYKVRPASDDAPERWETGTQNHEGLAGTAAAVDYLAWVGEQFGAPYAEAAGAYEGRRNVLKRALHAIKDYEKTLSQHLIAGLESIPGVALRGITDDEQLSQRVPTVIFTLDGYAPGAVAQALGEQGIYLWDGNYYALEAMQRLGYEGQGGMVRVGPVHYNTIAEIDRFLEALNELASA